MIAQSLEKYIQKRPNPYQKTRKMILYRSDGQPGIFKDITL